jgi:hypothetical protein
VGGGDEAKNIPTRHFFQVFVRQSKGVDFSKLMARISEGKITSEQKPLGAIALKKMAHLGSRRKSSVCIGVIPAPNSRSFQGFIGPIEEAQMRNDDHGFGSEFEEEPEGVLKALLEDDGKPAGCYLLEDSGARWNACAT